MITDTEIIYQTGQTETRTQQRRRDRAQEFFREAQEIADARYIPMCDAFKALRHENRYGRAYAWQDEETTK